MLADVPKPSSDTLDSVWRALADPTRRALLDQIRERPRTTGALADEFPQSRYAIMKHLAVLVDAGLVVVHRQGRERWNHLNAAPLQQMYERWVRPYEARWASPLLRFRDAVERVSAGDDHTFTSSPNMTTAPAASGNSSPASLLKVELAIPIDASTDDVWRTLTSDVHLWWPSDFHASPDAIRMRFDASLGGRLYEETPGGGGTIWYTVLALAPGKSIDLVGHLTPAFGGPSQSMLHLAVKDRGKFCVLMLTDALIGNVGAGTAAANEAGWRAIFETGFKKFAETGLRRDS
jgi:DNA-binding transcriptional ArsR family regulator